MASGREPCNVFGSDVSASIDRRLLRQSKTSPPTVSDTWPWASASSSDWDGPLDAEHPLQSNNEHHLRCDGRARWIAAREIDPRGRAHVANATRHFSYPSNFSVNHPVTRMTNSRDQALCSRCHSLSRDPPLTRFQGLHPCRSNLRNGRGLLLHVEK